MLAVSCTTTHVLGGASSVRLKSKAPFSWASANSFCVDTGRAEEVECQVGMWDDEVPEMEGEVWVTDAQVGDKMILVGLDCTFCGVDVMKVWGTSWNLTLTSRRNVLRPPGHSLSSMWYWG